MINLMRRVISWLWFFNLLVLVGCSDTVLVAEKQTFCALDRGSVACFKSYEALQEGIEGDLILARLYEQKNFQGSSITVITESEGCGDDFSYEATWNGDMFTVRSAQILAGCGRMIVEDSNDASTVCLGNCLDIEVTLNRVTLYDK